jgi:hypothetical protein
VTTAHATQCTGDLIEQRQRTIKRKVDAFTPVSPRYTPQWFTGPPWNESQVDVIGRSGVFIYEQLREALDFLMREKSSQMAGSNVNIAVHNIENSMATVDYTIYEMVGQEAIAQIYTDEVREK